MNTNKLLKSFQDQESCVKFLENLRWQNCPKCPYCASKKSTRRKNSYRLHCNSCNRSFSVTVGTFFHSTKLPLHTWFRAMCLIFNARKGISGRQLARELGINKNSAWALAMRIRAGMGEKDPVITSFQKKVKTHFRGKSPASMKGIERVQKRGASLGYIAGINLGKWIRPGFDSRKRPKIIPRQLRRPRTSSVEEIQIDLTRNLFRERRRKGTWTLINRSIIGQFHQISSKYLQAYLDEISFKKSNPDCFETFEKLVSNLLLVPMPFCGSCWTKPTHQSKSVAKLIRKTR